VVDGKKDWKNSAPEVLLRSMFIKKKEKKKTGVKR